jgi:hypothetical protein
LHGDQDLYTRMVMGFATKTRNGSNQKFRKFSCDGVDQSWMGAAAISPGLQTNTTALSHIPECCGDCSNPNPADRQRAIGVGGGGSSVVVVR